MGCMHASRWGAWGVVWVAHMVTALAAFLLSKLRTEADLSK